VNQQSGLCPTGQITADNRFEGDNLCFLHQHRPTLELVLVFPDLLRHFVNIRIDEMGRRDVFQLVEPENRNLCQDSPLPGDALNATIRSFIQHRDVCVEHGRFSR